MEIGAIIVGSAFIFGGIINIICRNSSSKKYVLFEYFWEEHEKAA